MNTRLRQRFQRDPWFRDRVIACAWLLVALVCWGLGAWPLWSVMQLWPSAAGVPHLVTAVVMAAALMFRSRTPMTQLGVGTVALAVDLCFGGSLGTAVMYTDVLYAAVRYGTVRRLTSAMALMLVGIIAATIAVAVRPPNDMRVLLVFVQLGVLTLVSVAWGWSVRNERTKTTQEMFDEHRQQTQALRQHVARDLHDLVANQVAVAGLHIEAAKLQLHREGAPAPVLTSLDRATHGTERAHSELRSLINLLTEVNQLEHSNFDVHDELRDLHRLIPAGRDLNWSGTLSEGAVADILENENMTRARVCIRIFREMITNAVKHGRGQVGICGTIETSPQAVRTLCLTAINEVQRGAPHPHGIGMTTSTVLASGIGASFITKESDAQQWTATLRVPLHAALKNGEA